MGKLIRLDIQGDFDLGFSVTAQVLADSIPFPLIAGGSGKLPKNPTLKEAYSQWQALYRNIVASFSTFSLTRRPSFTNISANIQENDFEPFRRETEDLATDFNNWLKHQDFQAIESLLRTHLEPKEENRILILTNNPWLRKLPWQEWDLLKDFPQTEIGFASPNFKQVQQSAPLAKDKVKILAILGYQAEVESQGQAIQNLGSGVEVTWLLQPQREELDEPLWKQQWDIIFFVGHGESQDEWQTGTIWINEDDKITIGELRNHFKKAIENGLKLAILNCCDGLGLAHSLAEGEDLFLPQMIVMREELPVAVAPRFLQYFLTEFTQDKSLYISVKEARQRLKILENQFPYASGLPVICQNPAVQPLRCHNLAIPPNPYRGLSAFQEKDAELFFGREAFINQLVDAVENKKLVAVIGASGSGKSSAVLAGLIPSLRQQGNWLIANLRPESTPFENLAKALLSSVAQLKTGGSEGATEVNVDEFNQLVKDLQGGNRALSDVIRSLGRSRRFLLVVDQFEEIYTYPNQKVQEFLDCLLEAVQNLSAFRLVITLRADFLGQAIKYDPFREQLDKWKPEFIGGMTRTELQAAIEEPAKKQNIYLEAGLTEHILNEVGEEPGNLPLLEFALEELWKEQENGLLTRQAYDSEKIGGVKNAICRHAEGVYDDDALKEGDKERIKQIFMKLVSPGEGTEYTRQLATRAEVGEENWDLVTHLATKRLVVSNRNETTQIETVEVVHEALIKAWPDLNKWIEEDDAFLRWKKRLQVTLREWEGNKKEEGYLLQGAPLGEAEGYLQQRGEDINKVEKVFIQLGLGVRSRTRRRTVLGLTSGLVAVSFFAVIAYWQRDVARQQSQVALSEQLAAQSLNMNQKDLDLALLLSLEANHISDEPNVRGSLASALQVSPNLKTFLHGHNDWIWSLAFNPSGTIIASGSQDGEIILWDAKSNQRISSLKVHKKAVKSLAFSPDRKTLASASQDGTIILWNIENQQLISQPLTNQEKELNSIAFSPNGQILASGSEDGTITLWDIKSNQQITKLTKHKKSVKTVAFSPDGETLASGSSDGTILLWNIKTQEIIGQPLIGYTKNTTGLNDDVVNITFSTDGRKLAAGYWNSKAIIWDAKNYKPIHELSRKSFYPISSVSFAPDNKILASASLDGNVILWDVETGQPIGKPLSGHSDWVNSIAFSSDGKTLASGSADKTIILWNIKQPSQNQLLNQLAQPLVGHKSAVPSIAFSPIAQILASGSRDGSISLWDERTGLLIDRLSPQANTYDHEIWDIAFSPDGKVLVSSDARGGIRLWDIQARKSMGLPMTSQTATFITSVAFSPDGQILASGGCSQSSLQGCQKGEIQLWDINKRQPISQPFLGHNGLVTGVAFSPDRKLLASSSDNGQIIIWDIVSGEQRQNIQTNQSTPLHKVIFSLDGQFLISTGCSQLIEKACKKGEIRFWDVKSGNTLGSWLTGHDDFIYSIALSPNGNILASGSRDGTILIWDFKKRKTIGKVLTGHTDSILGLAFNQNSQTLASSSWDGTTILWDVATHEQILKPLENYGSKILSVALSPNGQILATASEDQTIILWNTATHEKIGLPLIGHTSKIMKVVFSPDSKTLISAGLEVIFWDINTQKVKGDTLNAHEFGSDDIALSPDGETLVSSGCNKIDIDGICQENTIRFWSRETHSMINESPTYSKTIYRLAFSPDSNLLASGSEDGTITLWDVANRKTISPPLVGHHLGIFSLVFSPNGKILASGSRDSTVMLWNVNTKKPIGQPLTNHDDSIFGLAFSPDSKILASGGFDRSIILWDTTTRKPITTLIGHSDAVYSLAFTPDGKTLASGSYDGLAILWDIYPKSWQERACNIANRNMTKEEWQLYIPNESYRQTCSK